MSKPKRFGGASYQPKNLGAEPAAPVPAVTAVVPLPAEAPARKAKPSGMDAATLAALKSVVDGHVKAREFGEVHR